MKFRRLSVFLLVALSVLTWAQAQVTIPIDDGGTGASTAAGARANLGLDQINNTSDLAKPISTATQTALNAKTDVTTFNTVVNGRAPKQGLVFDGTGGASATVGVSSGDRTIAFEFTVPTDATDRGLFSWGGSYGAASLWCGYVSSAGDLVFNIFGSAVANNRTATITGFAASYGGKRVRVAAVVSSDLLTLYVNGGSVVPTTASAGTPPGWGYQTGNDTLLVGKMHVGNYYWKGFLHMLAYNRALSAAEVLVLHQTEVPAAADNNNAGNTSLVSSAFTNSTTPYGTFSGASATGFSATSAGGNAFAQGNPTTYAFVVGHKYRLTYTLTLNSGQAPYVEFGNVGVAGPFCTTTQLSAGANTLEITATATGSGNLIVKSTAATDFAISNVTLVPLGLLISPDPTQPGKGSTWYDTSGNGANITWSSGVNWVLPWSGTLPGPITVAGTLATKGQLTVQSAGGVPIATIDTSGGDTVISGVNTTRTTVGKTGGALATFDATTMSVTGNLVVSGTGASTYAGGVTISGSTGLALAGGNLGLNNNSGIYIKGSDGASKQILYLTTGDVLNIGATSPGNTVIYGGSVAGVTVGGTATTLAGNLTVAGTGAQSIGGSGATVSMAGTSAIKGVRTATGTLNFGTIAAGAGVTLQMTITGVAAGDSITVDRTDGGGFGDTITVQKWTSANTANIRLFNVGSGPVVIGVPTVRSTLISF